MKKTILFLLFLTIGAQVFYVGGYLQTPPIGARTLIKAANVIVFCAAAYALYKRNDLKPYYPVALAFALSALGLFLSWVSRDWAANLFNVTPVTPRGVALLKLGEAIPIVLPALILVPFFGEGYGSVYLQRGKFGLSMLLGIGLTVLLVLFFLLISDVAPKVKSTFPFLGWMLVFSFSNAFMEELLVRGLFLRPFGKFFSPFVALLLTTLIFTIMHFDASYIDSGNLIMAISYIFLLGLGTGAVMQRSENIWGAVLAHAAADIMLLITTYGTIG